MSLVAVVRQGRAITLTYGEVRESSQPQADSKAMAEIGFITQSLNATVGPLGCSKGW